MSTNVSGAFLSGISSVTGDRFKERLNAFNKFQKDLVIEDQMTDIINRQRKEESDVRNREAAMLGIKPAPSSASMYTRHYQVAEQMMNQLFDPSIMNQAAQDEISMAKWAAALDQLSTTISDYQQFYDMSFGDESKADGLGSTYMDAAKARQLGADQFFLGQGFEVNADHFKGVDEKLKTYDSKNDDLTVSLDFESGQFNLDGINKKEQGFYSARPEVASEVFRPNLTQASFLTAQEFANQPEIFDLYTNKGEASFKESIEARSKGPEMDLTIADYARKKYDKDVSAQDYLRELNSNPELFDAAREQWVEDVVEQARLKYKDERAKENKSNTSSRASSNKVNFKDVIAETDPTNPERKVVTLTGLGFGRVGEVDAEYVFIDPEDNQLKIVFSDGDPQPATEYASRLADVFGNSPLSRIQAAIKGDTNSVSNQGRSRAQS